ncbi:MAG TPA: hypothetical protein VE242_05410 [Chthoniobacterales bacterium]|nr:hypothetical protein [Chthoniobacterales bacterium]
MARFDQSARTDSWALPEMQRERTKGQESSEGAQGLEWKKRIAAQEDLERTADRGAH